MKDDSGKSGRHYRIESNNGRVRCFELNDGVRGVEVAASVNFHDRAWEEDYKACIAAEMLPLVAVSLQPSEIPKELESMPNDTQIVFRDASSAYDLITTAGRARKRIQEAIERSRRGVINIHEAAAMLALRDGGKIRDYVDMLQDAAMGGNLDLVDEGVPMRAIDIKARADFMAKGGLASKGYFTAFTVTTPAAVNRCLERVDKLSVISRLTTTEFPSPAPVAAASEPKASPEPVQAAPAKRVLASEIQDAAILKAIREAGYDPMALPKNPSGKNGVKNAIRNTIVGKPGTPFPKEGRQFDKSWERLRARKEIADA